MQRPGESEGSSFEFEHSPTAVRDDTVLAGVLLRQAGVDQSLQKCWGRWLPVRDALRDSAKHQCMRLVEHLSQVVRVGAGGAAVKELPCLA